MALREVSAALRVGDVLGLGVLVVRCARERCEPGSGLGPVAGSPREIALAVVLGEVFL